MPPKAQWSKLKFAVKTAFVFRRSKAFKQEGDELMYTAPLMAKRKALQSHPVIADQIRKFWQVIDMLKDKDGRLTKHAYIELNVKLQKAMVADFDLTEAKRDAEMDWRHDAGHLGPSDAMTEQDFHASMFELADHWTDGVDASEYDSFFGSVQDAIVQDVNAHTEEWRWKPTEDILPSKRFLMPPDGAAAAAAAACGGHDISVSRRASAQRRSVSKGDRTDGSAPGSRRGTMSKGDAREGAGGESRGYGRRRSSIFGNQRSIADHMAAAIVELDEEEAEERTGERADASNGGIGTLLRARQHGGSGVPRVSTSRGNSPRAATRGLASAKAGGSPMPSPRTATSRDHSPQTIARRLGSAEAGGSPLSSPPSSPRGFGSSSSPRMIARRLGGAAESVTVREEVFLPSDRGAATQRGASAKAGGSPLSSPRTATSRGNSPRTIARRLGSAQAGGSPLSSPRALASRDSSPRTIERRPGAAQEHRVPAALSPASEARRELQGGSSVGVPLVRSRAGSRAQDGREISSEAESRHSLGGMTEMELCASASKAQAMAQAMQGRPNQRGGLVFHQRPGTSGAASRVPAIRATVGGFSRRPRPKSDPRIMSAGRRAQGDLVSDITIEVLQLTHVPLGVLGAANGDAFAAENGLLAPAPVGHSSQQRRTGAARPRTPPGSAPASRYAATSPGRPRSRKAAARTTMSGSRKPQKPASASFGGERVRARTPTKPPVQQRLAFEQH
jgi:hypothetical protein